MNGVRARHERMLASSGEQVRTRRQDSLTSFGVRGGANPPGGDAAEGGKRGSRPPLDHKTIKPTDPSGTIYTPTCLIALSRTGLSFPL